MTVHDPDAGPARRARWRLGRLLLGTGLLALLPGLLVIAGLTAAGVVEGVAVPTILAGLSGVVGGWLLRRGTPRPVLHEHDLRVVALLGEDIPSPLRDLVDRHERQVDRLVDVVARLRTGPDLGREAAAARPARIVDRVLWMAAADLSRGADTIVELTTDIDGTTPAAQRTGPLEQTQARVEESLVRLTALIDTIGAASGPGAARHQQLLDELDDVTDWLGHRRQAMDELSGPERRRRPG